MLEQIELIDKLDEYNDIQPDDLNMRATKRNVMRLFNVYKDEVAKAGGRTETKVTPSYSIMPPSFSNEFHSSVETAALDNVEKMKEVNYFYEKIQLGLNSIKCDIDADRKGRRKRMLVMLYFENETPQKIMEKLAIEKTTYHEDMNMAVTQFTYALGLHVKLKF
ncbi:ArpU family phage packaging/lysis transcriptional regulator [Brochothrix thermosphacta]|uniref:ArpU family phage packaging/lysis transcriptional regulator n=1 Tax=Brochothrix thermosphacta TaxID=2756 RepID=UPI0039AFA423